MFKKIMCACGVVFLNLPLLHVLVYEGALNRTTCSLLPPLTQDETAVNDPVPSMTQAHSKSSANKSC